ncbi:MAG: TonB-dependent receptor [Chitinophagaceae bacterium]
MMRLQIASQRLKRWALLLVCISSSAILVAQTQLRTGKVTDENGKPVSNVSVTIKNAPGGTATNDDGVFTLNVATGATLVLSNVNFEPTEFKVGAEATFTITMRSKTAALSDVVVVGYGSQKKTNLTGAVATIDNKKIENRPVTNTMAALQGVAPGVTVTRTTGEPGNEGYGLQIRGVSSVNGSSALVLIDGAPGNLVNVSPADIESISVLKDAAAASIYGARAAGGVVLVTTKKGKSGKLSVTYNGTYGLQKPIAIPGKLHSWEEAQMLNEARINAGQSAGYTDEQIRWMKDPDTNYVVNPSNTSDYLYYYDLNQRSVVMRDVSPMWNHNISMKGGGQKDNFYFSLGYYKQQGVFKLGPDKSDRINARFNYSVQLSDKFSLDARVAYRQLNNLSPSVGNAKVFSYLYTTRSLYPTFFPGTTDKYINDNSGNFAYAFLKDGGASDYKSDEFNAQASLKAKDLVKGLTLTATYSPRLLFDRQTVVARTIPRYNIVGIGSYMNNPNSYSKYDYKQISNNLQLLADYNLNVSGDHDFHVLAGYAYEDQRNDNTTAIAKNLTSNDFFSLNTGDPTQASNSESIQTWALESYFGRLNYAFKNRYLFEANLRYDGSSRLSPNNRWHAFPSVSLGWRLSQEDWFDSFAPFFNELKLRASWGRLGNSDGVIGNYDYISLLTAGAAYPFNNQRSRSYYQASLASPQKTWETIETSNIGIDFGVLRNRLNVSADYFVKRNNDMLAPMQLSSIIGISTSTYNIAELKTWGWEVNVGWRDNVGKNFSYWVNANIGDNKNKVLKYNGQTSVVPGENGIIEGYSINTVWGYQAAGYYKDAADVAGSAVYSSAVGPGDIKYLDLNKDNKITAGQGRVSDHGDLVLLGNTAPRYTYGFDFGFNWKGFDFSAMFQGVGKRKLFLDPTALYPYTSSWIMPMDFNKDYWTPTNTDARFPRMYIGGAQNTVRSSHWLMNGSYLRLKNLQLGYNLPVSLIKKAKLNAAKIYLSGQDLWEINSMWLKKAFDAESPSNGTWQYPYFRTFSLGLNLTF